MTYQARSIGKTYQARNIGIAAVLAILAALLTAYFVRSAQNNAETGNAPTTVLVASGDIEAGTPGSDLAAGKNLEVRELPRDSVIPGAVASSQQVAGLVATDTIYAGEQVTVRRFVPIAEQGVLAELAGNQRALQLPGTQHQVLAGTLKEGDHVDVVASIKYRASTAAGLDETIASRIVLRDLLVLRAADDPDKDSGLAASVAPTLSVTLAVTDRQSQKLFWVMTNADWSLQLRPLNKPKDSPESVDTASSVLTDGLRSPFPTGR